jgi:four helix bundle protein
MRDYRKLDAFHLADRLALAVYSTTSAFPSEEKFGLAAQLRRAAVSAISNIVEGCSRHSERDFLRFLDMAYGSAREVRYQLSLAERLGYIDPAKAKAIKHLCSRTCRTLAGLMRSIRDAASLLAADRGPQTADSP